MNLGINLERLSCEELQDLINRYYANEKIKDLLEKFRVNCKCISCNDFKRWIIEDRYIYRTKKELDELIIKDKVYLASLLRGIETEKVDGRIVFMPLDSYFKSIAPTYTREIDILRHLTSKSYYQYMLLQS